MTPLSRRIALLCPGLALAALAAGASDLGGSWPGFRGPGARGVVEGPAAPVKWDVPKGENVLWTASVPGLAHASPVVWGDSVFVATAVREGGEASLKVGLYGDIGAAEDNGTQRYLLLRLDRKTGKVVWERTVYEGTPKQKRHTKATHANSTPATDGKRVVALFGSEGLYCYDLDGKLVWKKDLGVLQAAYFKVPDAQWGFASSPAIDDGVVYVQADVLPSGFLAAFSLADGRELWRTPRADVPTWSTPTVHDVGGRKIVLVNGWKHAGAYDAKTGKEVWKLTGQGDIPVPTPFVVDGLVFLSQAHGPGSPVYVVKADATGDVTLAPEARSNAGIVWSLERGGSYIPTPIVYRGVLYVGRDNGILTAYRAKTGEQLYQQRLGAGTGGFSASLVAADGKVYVTSEDGDVYVLKAGETFELLATNPLGEVAMATPAIADGSIFFRTRSRLVAVRDKTAPPAR